MSLYQRRKFVNYFNLTASILTTLFGLFFLAWIMWVLIVKGAQYIDLSVFTQITPAPGSEGGLINAIVGSLLLTVFGIVIGTPIGVMAGTFLAEYGKGYVFAPAVRFINDVLLSAPSIVIGVFVYEIMVMPMGHYSGWAGAVALAIIVIPVVVRTTENMLLLVPTQMREAAAALGAPQWKVIVLVVYKAALAGMVTGVILAMARIAGETAPLLFTALNNQFWTTNMNEPMANLPVVIFQFAMSPYEDWQHLAWAGALLITLFVLIMNISARSLLRGHK
ncbi:MAG: phosphate ABC transporter permease PstA [Halothiobacillaceae bacterium]|mgnify:CR=1 FL=1|jgi:phosphate transport system permease protein|nr:phosphate ABC transporter permease PstA [Halothiobacillaceae bacterium]